MRNFGVLRTKINNKEEKLSFSFVKKSIIRAAGTPILLFIIYSFLFIILISLALSCI